jgi:hypothetical protein
MAMLAIEPRIHAVRVCEVTSCDQGQVSRAPASLHDHLFSKAMTREERLM